MNVNTLACSAALLYAATSVSALAQVPEVLIEACNAVPDAHKRLECLKQALNVKAPSAKAPSDEPLRRAFVGLQGSINTGINLINYRNAVHEISRELAIFEREAPADAEAGLRKLKESLETYADAGQFWEAAIKSRVREAYMTSLLGVDMNAHGLEWMVTKHSLPALALDSRRVAVQIETGRQVMFEKANKLAEVGLKYIRDPKSTPAAIAEAEAAAEPRQQTIFGILVEAVSAVSGIKVLQVDTGATNDLQADDQILAINDRRVFTLRELREALPSATADDKAVRLLISRGGAQKVLDLQFARKK